MPRAFSDDLRSRVLAASRDGMSARYSRNRIWGWHFNSYRLDCECSGWLVDACETGSSRCLDAHEGFIVGEAKDITLNEMVLRLREERVVSIGRSALDVWLRRRAWTFKRPHMH